MAFERMKKAETYANECQIELGKIRVENSELDKMNVRTHADCDTLPLLTTEIFVYRRTLRSR